MTNHTIPNDHHHHHHRLRPHHQEMDQLQALAVKQPQVKKQARRRMHTSRPYQEQLLNMAEARREIVTALKIHRASTSTSTRQQQHHQEPPLQLQQQPPPQQVQVVSVSQDPRRAAVDQEASLAHTTMTSYAAAAASFASNNPLCSSRAAHWIAAGSYCSPPVPILRLPSDLTPPPDLPLPPTAAAAMGGLVELEGDLERLVRSLPAQPLGLNLSFQGFGVAVDDDGAKGDCGDLFRSLPLTTQPSPAASYSYSPPAVETATPHACDGHGHGSPSPALSATDAENVKQHSVMDAPPPAAAAAAALVVPVLLDAATDETMAQQASTGGEMMQSVEWSEAAAAADVATWWSKIFESGPRAPPHADDVAAAGLPAEWRWLCGDDDVVGAAEQGTVAGAGVLATVMHVDDGEDVILPCVDGIGDDVQAWDGEWFSCS